MSSPQSSQTRLPSIKEMFPEHLLAVRQPSSSPPSHHRDVLYYPQHSGPSTPPPRPRTLSSSYSNHATAPSLATYIPRALAPPSAQAASSYHDGYAAHIPSRAGSPLPQTSSSTTLGSSMTEARSPQRRQIYSFDVLKSDPSSDSLQHIASSATFPLRSAASTCQSTSASLANGSTRVFRLNVAGAPSSPPTQSTSIIKGHHMTHQHPSSYHHQPLNRHSIAVPPGDASAHAYSHDLSSSSRTEYPSPISQHAVLQPMHNSERAPHFSSVFSFSRPDYEASRSKSHLQQAHRLNALPGQGRVLDQEHEYPTSKLGEPIILDPRRIAAPAGMSNGNRPFSVGGNGLGFGFGFGEAHGNTNTNGSSNGNGTSGSNGGTGKKHICPTCSKKFNRPSSLKIHVNTHTGATPFRCPWPNCGREFNVNSNMRRHYRNHGSPGLVRAASEDEDTNARLPEDNVDGNRRRRRQPSNAAFPTVNMDMSFIETIDPSAPNTNSSQKLDLSTNAVPPNGAYTFVVGSGREVLSRKRRKLDDGYVAANQSMASPPPSSSEGDSEDDSEYEQTGPELRGEPLPMHVYEDELRGRSTRTMEYTDSALRTPPRGKHEGNPLHRYTSRSRSRSRSDNNISGPSSFPYSSAASSASSAPSVSLPSTPASASVSPPPSKPMPLSQDGKGRDHLYSPSEPYSKSFVDLHVSTALRPAFGDFDQNRSRSPPDYVQHRQSRREEHNPYPTRVHSPPRRWANGHETKEEW